MITSKQVRKAAARWQLYLLLAIPLAYIIIFHYVPIGGLQMAMKAFDLRYGIARSPWVGFRYFEKFLDSFQFSRILSNTLTLSFYSLFAGFPLPILLALLLNAAPPPTCSPAPPRSGICTSGRASGRIWAGIRSSIWPR